MIRQTCHEYDWIQVGGAIKHPEEGQVFNCSEELRKYTGVEDANLIVHPVSGYGNDNLVRELMNIIILMLFMIYTDPRFWKWMFDMSHEIRSRFQYFITIFGMTYLILIGTNLSMNQLIV